MRNTCTSGGHQGRLVWDGTRYTAYFGHNQNFGASIGTHQGDLMWFLDENGQRAGEMWSWGCSHSLDLRLALSGSDVGGVCLSDAYPQKAINFNHQRMLRDEPSGNMGGYSNARLGGLVGMGGGMFAMTFLSEEGRCESPVDGVCPPGSTARDVGFLRFSSSDWNLPAPVWLTTTYGAHEDSAHLARYGSGLLAAWKGNDGITLASLDENGGMIESAVIDGLEFAAKDDFATHANGDVTWGTTWGDNMLLRIVRVRACQ